jgi:ComF family protein
MLPEPKDILSGIRRYSRNCTWFFGRRCSICGTVIEAVSLGVSLCSECSKELKLRTGGFCGMCARIYALEDESTHLCFDCRNHSFSWEGMSFFSVYQGLLKELILRYKFSGDLGLGNALGNLLLEAASRHPYENIDSIIPVPIHPKRLWQRGFNQSLELSRILGRKINLCVEFEALIKTRHTPPQSSMKRKLRLKSLKNVFAVRDDKLKGKRILLVDDIMTTGSTLEQCTRTLLRAGVLEVRVVFLARAV